PALSDEPAAVTVFFEQPANRTAHTRAAGIHNLTDIRHLSRADQTAFLHSLRAARYPIPGCDARWQSGSLRKSCRPRGGRARPEFPPTVCRRGSPIPAYAPACGRDPETP